MLDNLTRRKQTWQLKKVQFQNASNDGYLKFRQDFAIVHFAVVQNVSQLMRSAQWRVVKPNSTSGFIALEFGVSCRDDLVSDVGNQLK